MYLVFTTVGLMLIPEHWHNHRVKVEMKLVTRIWWRWMPGTEITVCWPRGSITIDDPFYTMSTTPWTVESADPNDHYRPELERLVGRQGRDWDWCMKDCDVARDRLTIKFRRGKDRWGTYFALKWN